MRRVTLEKSYDASFVTRLALREKQIQQSYRPVIGIHKWFARRPGTVFRSLLLAEFNASQPLEEAFFSAHRLNGLIADPFMGGGTPMIEANRLGFNIIGADVNPMAYWIVRQALVSLDMSKFMTAAQSVMANVENALPSVYDTECLLCRNIAKVKYFLWVKTATCPACATVNDLFPGYLLAEAERHPFYVIACRHCGALNEYDRIPKKKAPANCEECGRATYIEGSVKRQKAECRKCEVSFDYMPMLSTPPTHRMWAMEYYCDNCKPTHVGRFFKRPDLSDLKRYVSTERTLSETDNLPIPPGPIPKGDETARLHRWHYHRYRDMFNPRQLLMLGSLLTSIIKLPSDEIRNALLTVFSDFIRYQNMVCRYDTYALKCQDIFSLHAYPVGLVQCENNVLGIPKVGSGSFIHFVEKYARAKDYCEKPFEVRSGKSKTKTYIVGEKIGATLSHSIKNEAQRAAFLFCGPADKLQLRRHRLDGVFTDPPYFDNVQYAELIDFCFSWLRQGLAGQSKYFAQETTRSADDLTGNLTLGRDIVHFADGLSRVFKHYAKALKPRAPFVFTYHHNSPKAYAPIVVAVLDARLNCTATLPAAAEMGASLHIARTDSSVLDSVFVCRKVPEPPAPGNLNRILAKDARELGKSGLRITRGDLRCLAAGHIARVAINRLYQAWRLNRSITHRLERATTYLTEIAAEIKVERLIEQILTKESE